MKLIHVFSIFGTAESFFDGQFEYLVNLGYEIVVVSSDSPLVDAFCRRNGVRFVPLCIPRSVSPSAITKAVKALCSLIRTEKADAVFGHDGLCVVFLLLLHIVRQGAYLYLPANKSLVDERSYSCYG